MSEDPHSIEIDKLVLRRQLLDRRDVIGQAVVTEIAVIVVVERFRAERRAEVVELDHDETELREGEWLTAVLVLPLPHAADLRPRIDVIDDRILFRRIELGRKIDDAIQVGDTITRLHAENLRWLEPRGR